MPVPSPRDEDRIGIALGEVGFSGSIVGDMTVGQRPCPVGRRHSVAECCKNCRTSQKNIDESCDRISLLYLLGSFFSLCSPRCLRLSSRCEMNVTILPSSLQDRRTGKLACRCLIHGSLWPWALFLVPHGKRRKLLQQCDEVQGYTRIAVAVRFAEARELNCPSTQIGGVTKRESFITWATDRKLSEYVKCQAQPFLSKPGP